MHIGGILTSATTSKAAAPKNVSDVAAQSILEQDNATVARHFAGTDSLLQDPVLTVGTLPNGLRYYIRVSTTPAKRARLWLAVNAGSIQEDDDQRGFAHFLEHMAFNGTKHFPKNTLIDFIEQSGMQFGGDLNAYTNFDETVYQLTVPTDDQAVLHQGLQVIQDWASGGITIDSTDVVEERGVVLGEWRMRNSDTAVQRLSKIQDGMLLGDSSRYMKRFPIGAPKLLRAALPAPVKRFYQDWYRPDLMAVIAVGDFDPVQMKREIETRFGQIPSTVNARQFNRPSIPSADTALVHVITDRVRPIIEVTWPAAEEPSDPVAAIRQDVMEFLLFQHLQHVLSKMSKQERRVFAGASARRTPGMVRPMGEKYALGVFASPDSLERAFVAVLTEVQRVAQHGIPVEVLEREKGALLRRVEHAADAEDAIPSQQLAQAYVRHYLRGGNGVLLSPKQELNILKQFLPSVTPETTKKMAEFWRTSGPPTVMVTMPLYSHVRTPTREIVMALLDSVANASIPVRSISSNTVASTAPSAFVTPQITSKIVKEQLYKFSNVTAWTLSNGIRVLFKPTNFKTDELILQAGSLGGMSRVPDSLFYTPGRFVGALMTSSGGLGDFSRDALEQKLDNATLSELRVAINAFDEEVSVAGSPKDMETMFQLMHLQFVAPKIDTATLVEWKRTGANTLTMSSNDKLAAMLANGEPRLTPATQNAVNMLYLMDTAEAMAVYRDRFGDPGDFTFTIVGAASAHDVKPLVERYFATLKTSGRRDREQPRDLKIKPLENKRDVRSERPDIPPEKAQSTLLFDGVLSETPLEHRKEQRALSTLSWVLGNRLRNRLREEMAVTYGVSAPVRFYRNPKPHYLFDISVLTAPDRIDESVKNIWQIIDSVRDTGITADELTKATTVARRARENAMQDNRWWVTQMLKYDQAGLPLDEIISGSDVPVTSADVQAAAHKYLSKDVYLQRTILPEKEAVAKYEKKLKKEDADSTTRDKAKR